MEKKTYHDGHVALWDWLAKTGSYEKIKAPVWKDKRFKHLIRGDVEEFHCFACYNNCIKCPIEWVKGTYPDCSPLSKDSPFVKWRDAETIEERKHWAAIIRDLLWTEK